MTVTDHPDRQPIEPGVDTQSVLSAPTSRPGIGQQGRPRIVEDEEAYLRSAMERARIDIAAGW